MSAPAFTPGPWGVFDDDERFAVAVGQIGEDVICEPLGDTSKQAEANGYLIASAPSLYAELNEARLAFIRIAQDARTSSKMRDIAGVRSHQAAAMLARARGEQ